MLEELMVRFGAHLAVLRGMHQKSIFAYQCHIREFFAWYGRSAGSEDIHVGGITRQDIEAFLKHLYFAKQNGNYTRKTKLTTLRCFWRFLVYEGVVGIDVTVHIPTPIVRNKLIQAFSRNDVIRMFDNIDMMSNMGLRDCCILILLAFAGLRVSELVGLRLNDLVDDDGYIDVHINEQIGKKGSSRRVDLWKAPSVFIREWMRIRIRQGANGDDPLFVSYRRGDLSQGKPLAARQVDRIVKRLADGAKIIRPRITTHMFRATHGSDLRCVRGYDIAAIADRLGHKNISTTDRYLPRRDRIKKEYRSLREYWIDFERIWTGDIYG